MIVNMFGGRNRRADRSRGGADQGVRLSGALDSRRGAHGDRHRRQQQQAPQRARGAALGAGRGRNGADFASVQAGGAQLPSRRHDDRSGQGRDHRRTRKWWWRRGRARWNRRSRSTSIAASVARAGRETAARRRVQAAQLAVQLSGPGRGRPEADARRRGQERAAGGQRSDGPVADRSDAAVRGRAAGGRAQHAELSSAARRWAKSKSRCC